MSTWELVQKIYDRVYEKQGPLNTYCHIWAGASSRGYGAIRLGKLNVKTHRLVCDYYHGPIPEDKCVMHLCDNRLCVNPDHLQIGTQLKNVQDSIDKGRRDTKGSNNAAAILTETQVIAIKEKLASGIDYNEIATQQGVSRSTIQDIKHGRSWRHI